MQRLSEIGSARIATKRVGVRNIWPNHTYIGQLERGEKNATIESISKIAGALGVSLSRLFENISIEQQEDNLPAQCYALLQEQPVNDQKALAEILAALIQYKKA